MRGIGPRPILLLRAECRDQVIRVGLGPEEVGVLTRQRQLGPHPVVDEVGVNQVRRCRAVEERCRNLHERRKLKGQRHDHEGQEEDTLLLDPQWKLPPGRENGPQTRIGITT